jgi:hypothetical protein
MKAFLFVGIMSFAAFAHAGDSVISDDAKKCFEWFATLGYPEVKEATFAEVSTGGSSQSGDDPPTAITIRGFVTPKQDGHFEVVGVDLLQGEYTTNDSPAKPEEHVGFKARPFMEYCQQKLDRLRHPPKDPWDRFGSKIGIKSETFFLAYCCWRQGENAMAQSLFVEAQKSPSMNSGNSEDTDSMRLSLEKELGHYAMWDAVLQCGGAMLGAEWGHSGELEPRTELLRNFENVLKRFPACEHADRAKKMIHILKRMIAEDKDHKPVTDEELSKLPIDRQVAELIFRLRDQNGHQSGQPGWCDIFNRQTDGETPAHRLVKIGYDAVPQLIDSLTDDRHSRSVGFHRDFWFSHTVLTIGDCAQQILNRITSSSLYSPRGTSGDMSREEQIAADQKGAREWWARFKAKGERQMLVDEISSASDDASNLVPKLKEKYPDAVADAVLAGAAKAKTDWQLQRFVELVGDIKTDAVRDFLVRQLDHGLSDSVRLAAARQLWNREHPGVVEKVITLWDRRPEKKRISFDDSFEPCVDFLAQCGRVIAVQALADDIDKWSTIQRFEIVEALGYAYSAGEKDPFSSQIAKRPPEPAAVQSAIALLAKELEDTGVRDGMGGSRGEFEFSDPRICDFALWALHAIEPETYAFSAKATKRKRDEERITASNVWRLSNKLPLLPVPTSSLPVLNENEALRITSIEFKPKDASNELVTMTKKLMETKFTPQAVSSILLWFGRNEVKGVKGLSIEVTREDDLRGVAIEAVLTPGELPPVSGRDWGTHYNVVLDGKSIGNSSGSSSASYLQKDDAWQGFEDAANEACKLPPKQPFAIRAGLRAQ